MLKEEKALRDALHYPKGEVDYRRFDRMIRALVRAVQRDCQATYIEGMCGCRECKEKAAAIRERGRG